MNIHEFIDRNIEILKVDGLPLEAEELCVVLSGVLAKYHNGVCMSILLILIQQLLDFEASVQEVAKNN